MSVVTSAVLKQYFQTGKKPTETQFANLIDTLFSRGTTSSGVYTTTTDITAFAGGGQADATQLTTEYNKVTTVATDADSVKMMDAIVGQRMLIVNAGVSSLAIYPKTGELFEGLSANTKVDLSKTASLEAFCFATGIWTLL